MKSINPYSLETLKEFKETTSAELEDILQSSNEAFHSWKKIAYESRAILFKKLSALLKSKSDFYAEIITKEMGKLLPEAKAEVLKCADACEYYALYGESFLTDEEVKTDASKSFVTFQPLGVILAIMPWNFPFWQVIRFAAPTIMAGNVAILKHSSNVSMCALELEKLFIEAGFPDYVFKTVLIGSERVANIISDSRVKAVTLTGSTPAGKSVAKYAGENLKKCVLELGGSDAYVILSDADLDLAVDVCTKSRMLNAGQSCIAAKRFIVSKKLYVEFKNAITEKFKNFKLGDPMDLQTTLAPLARVDLRDELHQQVRRAIDNSAKLIMGGHIPSHVGAFYEPTLLEKIDPTNPAFNEEFFGPVGLLFEAKDDTKAIEIANHSAFGLGAAVFTKDLTKGINISKNELEAGSCFVNALVRSDPRLPFGGTKMSGFGRELSSFGIREFVNIKTVYAK